MIEKHSMNSNKKCMWIVNVYNISIREYVCTSIVIHIAYVKEGQEILYINEAKETSVIK